MQSPLLSLILFFVLIACSAAIAVEGLRRDKPAYLGIALFVGTAGAVLIAAYTEIRVMQVGTIFACTLGLLGALIIIDGARKKDLQLWLQGLIQFLVAGLLFAYARVPAIARNPENGWRPVAIGAVNLPWLALSVILVILVVRSTRSHR